MRFPWLSPILGALCLIGAFFVGNMNEGTYCALSEHAQAQYHHNAVVGGFIGLGISLAVAVLGCWAWADRSDSNRRGGRQGCLGAVLGLIASFFWLIGILFPPYEF